MLASGRRPTVKAVCRVLVVDMGLRGSPETRALALAAVAALGLPVPTEGTLRDMLKPGAHTVERAEAHRVAMAKRMATPHGRRKHHAAVAKMRSTPEGLAQARAAGRAATAKRTVEGKGAAYQNARYRDDPTYRLRALVSTRINSVLRKAKRGLRKSTQTLELLGCTVTDFMAHLEARFAEGMTWDNHGTAWHVDHVVPVAAFDLSTEEGQRAAFHHTNCQPLWAADNLSKGSLHEGMRHRYGS